MTHETRIALLVGLVFIVLFGLVLGQRSISFSKSYHSPQSAMPAALTASPPGPEVVSAAFFDRDDRPVLAPPAESPSPPASVSEPPRDEQGVPAPATPNVRPEPAGSVVAPPGQRTYQVCPGDTLIRIARKVYGRGREGEHLLIYRANSDKLSKPEAISVGQVLVIPSLPAEAPLAERVASGPVQEKHYTEMTLTDLSSRLSNDRTYVVRSGDCLTNIARKTIGSGSRSAVRKLLDANRDRIADPNRLTVGMRLIIPAS